jgi:hypothetical protein
MKVSTSLWDDPVEFDEVEVHISRDGLGRASIARRPDGLLCIYVHWKFPPEIHRRITGTEANVTHWQDDTTPLEELYRDVDPEIGLYGELEDARREIRTVLLGREERAQT